MPHSSEVDKVREALIEAARSVPEVMRNPDPRVNFVEFADTSIKLELLVWIGEPHKHAQIRSSVNYQIARVYRKYGFSIALTQPNVPVLSLQMGPESSDNMSIEQKH
jgi:potassium efflux system protein